MTMLEALATSTDPELTNLIELYRERIDGSQDAALGTLEPRMKGWGRKGGSHFKSNTFTRK